MHLMNMLHLFCGKINIKYLHVCFMFCYRAKAASNNNEASGADDSDLEKMKQVNMLIDPAIVSTWPKQPHLNVWI